MSSSSSIAFDRVAKRTKMRWFDRLDGSLLVLAPHADDEILGCGGTVALLNDGGGSVVIVFVTAIGRRRAQAPAALAIIGGAVTRELGLPEGSVAAEPAATLALARLIDEIRPAAVA